MLVPLVLLALPLPGALSVWNGSFFTRYPLTLGTLDPAFQLPPAVWGPQCALLAAGAVLLALRPGGGRKTRRADKTA